MSGFSLALQWYDFVRHVQGSNHASTILSCGLLLCLPTFISVRHLEVLLLRKNLWSSQIALLCLLILSLCTFGFGHASRRCSHVSIDCVWHSVQLVFRKIVG
jgi:hypothetical protein